jgi:type I restriction enzyme S subunit
MKLTCDKSSVDPTFLFYFFRSPTGRHELLKNASTVGTPGIATPLSSLKSIRVPLPPLQEQKAIAHILGALDDKIELNRQMNEALEAMARALFKSWFVNFDPVRAKAEGGDPGLPKPIADLFPEGLDDEGLPIGWRRVPFLEKAELLSGGTPSTDEPAYWVGSILWASAKDISQARDAFLIATERTITERGVDESATQIIPKLATVVVARGATTGRFCMLGRDMAMNQTCYALRSRIAHPLWINLAFASLVDELVHSAHGSVFDTITTKTFDSAQTIDPGGKILDRFETYVGPLFERILLNIEQSQTLAAVRDALLPKLISGELRVTNASHFIESAL